MSCLQNRSAGQICITGLATGNANDLGRRCDPTVWVIAVEDIFLIAVIVQVRLVVLVWRQATKDSSARIVNMTEVGEKLPLEQVNTSNEKAIVDHGVASLRGSKEGSSGEIEYIPDDPKAERILTAKIDMKVMPILGLLYLICFLDRTNIANARLVSWTVM